MVARVIRYAGRRRLDQRGVKPVASEEEDQYPENELWTDCRVCCTTTRHRCEHGYRTSEEWYLSVWRCADCGYRLIRSQRTHDEIGPELGSYKLTNNLI